MKPNDVDFEELKKIWLAMGETLGTLPTRENNPTILRTKKTALDRLRNKYRVFWIVSILMIISTFIIFSRGILVDSEWGGYLGVAYAVYFLTTFVMDHWLWVGIGTIDPIRMGVTEVAEKSMFYKKRHLQFMTILIPMAIMLLGFTGFVFSSDKYLISGMFTGAIVGAVMGYLQFRRFMEDYKDLSE